MDCNREYAQLMHQYLDGDLNQREEAILRLHLEGCEVCQKHFHELKRTLTFIQSTEHISVPESLSSKVMQNLPTEKKQVKYKRWFKAHPVLTAAAIFFVLMIGSVFSSWSQDSQLVVSKQENLVIEGDTVIVPEGITVPGDLLVKNGDLMVKGTIEGDVTIVNGELLEDGNMLDEESFTASVGEVNGEFNHVDQFFEWIWYTFKNLFKGIFTF
ncbi:anti-sigma factor RsiW [Virgibacillus halotolerans]|uniref:zf-HC2 domain-containing protein n=1 Tax=Virgibacillus halotolerans TaxID=1071053 RepID=UPI00195FCD31|nr:zf-HC2 domain-containing protein [Virgibacillus halotolerans]MBM7599451.1 anti-sigma factor RsiW [Virgibacillus halotolerans]